MSEVEHLFRRVVEPLALCAALLCGEYEGRGQGTILFDTHVPGIVDARWWLSSEAGVPFGAGWTAQLFAGPVGSPLPVFSSVTPLFPTTTFRPSSSAESGYVNPVVVTVPNMPPGAQAFVIMTAYPDVNPRPPFSTAVGNGIIVTLGGDGQPPAYLQGFLGLAGFIPEPSPVSLAAVGAVLFFLVRGFQQQRNS